ncbi:hypothetical protein JOQ06_025545 [Pogonophryne albipinna]|uniref:Uncharacterized protein n=1 Tax=Pogonophryne albipinna TaxID=1090488 RepID=A0AAD6AUW5_9TELE|nr:hypothetical protein JOQ06_025545 [Pogonophryne albipinna]
MLVITPAVECSQGWMEQGQSSSPETLDLSDETTDTEDHEEEDLGVLDDQRNIMLHLLSQLKLGMDLTRVRLCLHSARPSKNNHNKH